MKSRKLREPMAAHRALSLIPALLALRLLPTATALHLPDAISRRGNAITRRGVLAAAAAAAAPRAAHAVFGDGQQLQRDHAELETSPLIEELKRRTEANKEANAASGRAMTSQKVSVYDPELTMVRYAGAGDSMPVTRMMTPQQIKELQALGYELDCPNVKGMACGLKPKAAARAPPPPPEPAAVDTATAADADSPGAAPAESAES